MDPNGLPPGLRRVIRQDGRHALRYDRDRPGHPIPATIEFSDEDEDDTLGRRVTFGRAEMEPVAGSEDPDSRPRGRAVFQRHMREEMLEQDEPDDEDSGVDETSLSGVDNGDASDSDGLTGHYGEMADEDLLDEQDGEFEFGSQQDMPNDDDQMISFDPMLLGLKEINNLAHFSVSSHKPGNGVEELLSDDLSKYWQSDGPQPHLLTIHFLRRVEIRAIRFYVDYNQDESYTPTVVMLSAGTGHHDLIEFATLPMVNPVGWQEVDLSTAGGGDDGQSLCCWIVQVKVKENHQNGKDTHIRGIKIYALDENAPPADTALDELAMIKARALRAVRDDTMAGDDYLFERLVAQSPDRLPGIPERSGSISNFLRDSEIR